MNIEEDEETFRSRGGGIPIIYVSLKDGRLVIKLNLLLSENSFVERVLQRDSRTRVPVTFYSWQGIQPSHPITTFVKNL